MTVIGAGDATPSGAAVVAAVVGAVQAYDNAIGQYKSVPFVPDVKADLTQHVLERALHGLFLYLAQEEAAIRQNPAKRTTELLQRVFGAG